MKILDSDLLIAYLKDNREAVEKMSELSQSKNQIKTTVLNAQELLFGAMESEQVYSETKDFLTQLGIIDYSLPSAEKAIEVSHHLKKQGARIGIIDEIIAGICKTHKATIVTRNTKHFNRVNELKVENW